jgi:peptide/nickel transport system permease protein
MTAATPLSDQPDPIYGADIPAKTSEKTGFLRHMLNDPTTFFGLVIVIMLLLIALLAPLIAPYGANENTGSMISSPSFEHLFGTNIQGRDLFSRVILGSRSSLGIAVPAVLLAVSIGLPLGMLIGFKGGLFDSVFVRFFDILFSLPTILFAIALVAYLGPSVRNLILTIMVLYIPRVAMVARAPTLSIKEREFVLVAKMFGGRTFWTLRKHILPNIAAPVLVETSLLLSEAILTEAALSFLGLGIQPPHPSWGADLGRGREFMELGAFQVVFPGMMIMSAVLGFNLLGDGLRDFFDPRVRK